MKIYHLQFFESLLQIFGSIKTKSPIFEWISTVPTYADLIAIPQFYSTLNLYGMWLISDTKSRISTEFDGITTVTTYIELNEWYPIILNFKFFLKRGSNDTISIIDVWNLNGKLVSLNYLVLIRSNALLNNRISVWWVKFLVDFLSKPV